MNKPQRPVMNHQATRQIHAQQQALQMIESRKQEEIRRLVGKLDWAVGLLSIATIAMSCLPIWGLSMWYVGSIPCFIVLILGVILLVKGAVMRGLFALGMALVVLPILIVILPILGLGVVTKYPAVEKYLAPWKH